MTHISKTRAEGHWLKVTYKSGAILTGPAVIDPESDRISVALDDGFSILVAQEYDGKRPHCVEAVEVMDDKR